MPNLRNPGNIIADQAQPPRKESEANREVADGTGGRAGKNRGNAPRAGAGVSNGHNTPTNGTMYVNASISEVPASFLEGPDLSAIQDNFRADMGSYWRYTMFEIFPLVLVPFAKPARLHVNKKPSYAVTKAKEETFKLKSMELQTDITFRKIGFDGGGRDDEDGRVNEVAQEFFDREAVSQRERYMFYIEDYETKKHTELANVAEDAPGSQTWWADWAQHKLGTGVKYDDFVFHAPDAEDVNKTLGEPLLPGEPFVDINSHYNYFNRRYENFDQGNFIVSETNQFEVNEKIYPNLYTYLAVAYNNSDIVDSNMPFTNETSNSTRPTKPKYINIFEKHLTIDGLMATFDVNSLFYKEESLRGTFATSKFDLGNSTINNYINLWAKTIAKRSTIEGDASLSIKNATTGYDNIVIAETDLDTISNYNAAQSSFPMSVSIKIKPEGNNSVMHALKATNYNPYMMKYILNSSADAVETFVISNAQESEKDTLRESWNFQGFLDSTKNKDFNKSLSNNDDMVFVGDISKEYDFSSPQNKIFSMLMGASLQSKIRSIARNTRRSFEDILNGGTAYSETLFYEVEKWKSTFDGTLIEKLQSFFIPNTERDMLEYVDTQVKYRQPYVYRIMAYKIVFGTQYEYVLEDLLADDDKTKGGAVDIITNPNIKIFKVPYYNVGELDEPHAITFVEDEPPLAPEIEFVPLVKSPDVILINIKDTIGSAYLKPTPIDPADAVEYQRMLVKQLTEEYNLSRAEVEQFDLSEETLLFSSDEPSRYMQTFATTDKPTSYSDFQDKNISRDDGPNVALKMTLNYNRKYYFVFRAIDFHGKFSNPTDVYEVEIRNEDGMTFPLVRVFNIEEENERDEKQRTAGHYSLTGKRFIYIKPSYPQWTMKEKYETGEDEENPLPSAFAIEDFSIGEVDKSVFQENRKFKMRLKSKKTGRIIDFNLRFRYKQEKIIE
tara:strand:+ start:5994 stop:8846 length:2853 start_codon:yes stop_codon:yes gene_type:complete